MATYTKTHCDECNMDFPSPYFLQKHRKAVHPKPVKDPGTLSPLDRLHALRQEEKKIIGELDVQRASLHAKIVEIDNIISGLRRAEANGIK